MSRSVLLWTALFSLAACGGGGGGAGPTPPPPGPTPVPVPRISIVPGAAEAFADADQVTITASLSRASANAVVIDIATIDGTARAGRDYTATSATVTVPAGRTGPIELTVPLLYPRWKTNEVSSFSVDFVPRSNGSQSARSEVTLRNPPDEDRDRIHDSLDNCPYDRNIDQTDSDFDGVGNSCDPDHTPVSSPPESDRLLGRGFKIKHFIFNEPERKATLSIELLRGMISGMGENHRTFDATIGAISYGAAKYVHQYADGFVSPRPSAEYRDLSAAEQTRELLAIIDQAGEIEEGAIITAWLPNPAEGKRPICYGYFHPGFPYRSGTSNMQVLFVLMYDYCATPSVMAHELLHVSRASHASGVSCGSYQDGVPLSFSDPFYNSKACSEDRALPRHVEYATDHDVMGFFQGFELNSPEKARLGWLAPDNVLSLNGLSSQVRLDALEYKSQDLQAIRIPLGAGVLPASRESSVWIEHRASMEADSLEASTSRVFIWNDFVRSRTQDPEVEHFVFQFATTYISDVYPDGIALDPGDTFHDPHRGIEVVFLDVDRNGNIPAANVRVDRSPLQSNPGLVLSFHPDSGSSLPVTLTNTGNETIRVGAAAILGRHASEFSIIEDFCKDVDLAGGASCVVQVGYAMTRDQTLEGAQALESDAILLVPNNDRLRPRLTVALESSAFGPLHESKAHDPAHSHSSDPHRPVICTLPHP